MILFEYLSNHKSLFKFEIMDQLIYVPNPKDKEKIQSLFQEQRSLQKESQISQKMIDPPVQRELNKQQLDALLRRLTKNTKKQYDVQQQTTHILHENKNLQQKRVLGEKVQNRLLAKGIDRERKIVEMGQQLEQERKEKVYRQKPSITEKAQKIIHKSIDRRLTELMSERQNKMSQLQKKYKPSFQPVIDSHSEFINDIENLGDLLNRMNTKEKESLKRKATFLNKITEEQKKQLTFQPHINEKSKQMTQNLPPRPPYSRDPLVKMTEVYPFAPSINKNTDKLLKNREKDDCFIRLFNGAKEQSLKKKDKRDERQRAISFKPSINKKSRKLADSRKTRDDGTQEIAESNGDSDFFEEIKIGNCNQTELSRDRTYSLRGSQIAKRPWLDDLDHQSFKDLKSTVRERLNLMK